MIKKIISLTHSLKEFLRILQTKGKYFQEKIIAINDNIGIFSFMVS